MEELVRSIIAIIDACCKNVNFGELGGDVANRMRSRRSCGSVVIGSQNSICCWFFLFVCFILFFAFVGLGCCRCSFCFFGFLDRSDPPCNWYGSWTSNSFFSVFWFCATCATRADSLHVTLHSHHHSTHHRITDNHGTLQQHHDHHRRRPNGCQPFG